MDNSIFDKLDFLEKWILQVDSNVKFNMTMQWTILGVVVASVGVALYALSKIWVNKRVEQELDKKLNIIENNIKQEMVDFIKENPQILYTHGTISPMKIEKEGDDHYATIQVYQGQNISLYFPTIIEVYYKQDNKKILVEDIQSRIAENNLIEIRYKMPQSCIYDGVVYWNITWQNELYR